MQGGQESKAVWPFMAPMMAFSPQLWLGALFGTREDGATRSVAATASPLKAAESTLQNAAHVGCGCLKANAEAGAEMAALVGRRHQAYIGLAADLGRCRTAQDVMSLQMRFWQTAVQQHSDAARQIATAWSGVMPMLAGLVAQPAVGGQQMAPPRDRITFTEPKDNGIAVQSPRQQSDRRSAA